MDASEQLMSALEERVRRHPPDRYPVQHATARFHHGMALAAAGDLDGAEWALVCAAQLFDAAGMAAEHGKALNALGGVLRSAGRHDEAAAILLRAVAAFEASALPLDLGTACFNLGVVRRDQGDHRAADAPLARARELFDECGAVGLAAAAARELGAAQLAAGQLGRARDSLLDAADRAERAGDAAGVGETANLLGLLHLACHRFREAHGAFATAAAAHPRTVRPADHAMAKANLALACERAGDHARARLAARHALTVHAAADAVRSQASETLTRLGDTPGSLFDVLDEEPPERWRPLVGDEVASWADADASARRRQAEAWIEGQSSRPAAAPALAEAWVGALLELPPDDMEAIMRSVVEALRSRDPGSAAAFRTQVASASARFHVPQLMRLRDGFNSIAIELGEEPVWR